MRSGLLPTLLLAALGGAAAGGSDLLALERAVQAAAAQRARLVEERTARSAEAAAQATQIARLKAREPAPRAGRDLERRLREFDRLASVLDDLDARIAMATRAVERACGAFEAAADAEADRLARTPDARRAAEDLRALEQARRSVASASAAPQAAFRAVLEVRLEPEDGAREVAAKLDLLQAERHRAVEEIGRVEEQERLLVARLEVKRQLASQVEAARRDAGGDFDLLAREAEDLRDALRELVRQKTDLKRHRAEIGSAIRTLDARIQEFRARSSPSLHHEEP